MYTLVSGERLNGIQEVNGSIPSISTRNSKERLVFKMKASLFPLASFSAKEPPVVPGEIEKAEQKK